MSDGMAGDAGAGGGGGGDVVDDVFAVGFDVVDGIFDVVVVVVTCGILAAVAVVLATYFVQNLSGRKGIHATVATKDRLMVLTYDKQGMG